MNDETVSGHNADYEIYFNVEKQMRGLQKLPLDMVPIGQQYHNISALEFPVATSSHK
jgi:hypothetical protein